MSLNYYLSNAFNCYAPRTLIPSGPPMMKRKNRPKHSVFFMPTFALNLACLLVTLRGFNKWINFIGTAIQRIYCTFVCPRYLPDWRSCEPVSGCSGRLSPTGSHLAYYRPNQTLTFVLQPANCHISPTRISALQMMSDAPCSRSVCFVYRVRPEHTLESTLKTPLLDLHSTFRNPRAGPQGGCLYGQAMDPKAASSPGKKVTHFSLAVSNRWKSKEGEMKESTEWVNIEAWGRLGEVCQEYLKKAA
jgi:hypothetical protein